MRCMDSEIKLLFCCSLPDFKKLFWPSFQFDNNFIFKKFYYLSRSESTSADDDDDDCDDDQQFHSINVLNGDW